ncbi:hypothetical protein [Aquisalimonas sp.]|nr:hypothetical protein [Aquisalimonas sp.]
MRRGFRLAARLRGKGRDTWCVFNNTATPAGLRIAIDLRCLLDE